jgi:hypothetical protein
MHALRAGRLAFLELFLPTLALHHHLPMLFEPAAFRQVDSAAVTCAMVAADPLAWLHRVKPPAMHRLADCASYD